MRIWVLGKWGVGVLDFFFYGSVSFLFLVMRDAILFLFLLFLAAWIKGFIVYTIL